MFYELAENKEKKTSKYALWRLANRVLSLKIKEYFDEFNPDIIVSTHIFASQLVDEMKQKGELSAPAIGIVTDYTIHPFWEDVSNTEYIVTANDLFIQHAKKKDIDPEKVLPFGIPINKKFSKKISKADARKKLGINPEKKTVLIMGGSMGYGSIEQTLAELDRLETDFQMLVVCGNNRKLKAKLNLTVFAKQVYVYGFVDNVDIMMDAADCIVTKPGGLTTSEALAKVLPMILVDPIPGQEERNLEFLINSGAAMAVTKTFSIDYAVYFALNNPDRIENMKRSIQMINRPHATDTLCEFLVELIKKKERNEQGS
jgi:processive 1,2-diacylglycerol beta-glucosyltransferase